MNNVHPVFAQALAPIIPPAVTEVHQSAGTGGIYIFKGADFDAVYDCALDAKNALGPYRSPAVISKTKDAATGLWTIELRYYGLD